MLRFFNPFHKLSSAQVGQPTEIWMRPKISMYTAKPNPIPVKVPTVAEIIM